MKINELKLTLNTALTASKKLQLFDGVSKHHVLISFNQLKWCMLINSDLLEVSNNHIIAFILFLYVYWL